MKLKRIHIVLFVLMSVCPLWAAEPVEHENILKVKYGWVSQLDPYFSPLVFTGNQIGIANEWWQPFRRTNKDGQPTNWSHAGAIDIHGLRAYNSAHTNLIYGLGGHAGWGAYYRFSWLENRLCVILGPYLETDFMVREIASNVNKPLSFDVGIDAMAMAGLQWTFYGKKTSYRLRYRVRTNVIGFDWSPEYWQSYYEIATGVSGLARCSGHWNHNAVRHELSLDFHFPHSSWRLGAEHEFLNYATPDMQFTRNQFSIIIGCIWHYRLVHHSPTR